jgi:hypothetical protein
MPDKGYRMIIRFTNSRSERKFILKTSNYETFIAFLYYNIPYSNRV